MAVRVYAVKTEGAFLGLQVGLCARCLPQPNCNPSALRRMETGL